MASFAKKLCRSIERHPVLYDSQVRDRVPKQAYDAAWEAVAVECNEPVGSIKTRWYNIKKVLKRSLENCTNPQRKTRYRENYLFEELKFLVPHLNGEQNMEEFLESDAEVRGVSATRRLGASSDDSSEQPLSVLMNTNMECDLTGTERRKRATSTKALTVAQNLNEEKQKAMGAHFLPKSVIDGSSSIRFRRIVNHPADKKQPQKETRPSLEKSSNDFKEIDMKVNQVLRSRSKSMYIECLKKGDDSDSDYNPPKRKKSAVENKAEAKEEKVNTKANVTRRPRGRARANAAIAGAEASTTTTSAEVRAQKATASSTVATPLQVLPSPPHSNATTISVEEKFPNYGVSDSLESVQHDEMTGIDFTLLAAAAAAEARAEAEEEEVHAQKIKLGKHEVNTATQCTYEVDEEDEEFFVRMRKWIQMMNPRQKILFRKGIYQAYIDVYDDPRNFQVQTGNDKFAVTQLNGMPALFTGMTPVELRLVRHLAIAVAGHKLSMPIVGSPYTSHETNCMPSSNVSNIDQSTSVAYASNTYKQQNQAMLPTERSTLSEKSPNIVRTTPIAIPSVSTRKTSNPTRILRKVVRITGNSSPISSSHYANNTACTDRESPNNLRSNSNVVRTRAIAGNVGSNCVSPSSNDKHRVYRILQNGTLTRQLVPNSCNNSSPPSNANGNFLLPSTPVNLSHMVCTQGGVGQRHSNNAEFNMTTSQILDAATGNLITKISPTRSNNNNSNNNNSNNSNNKNINTSLSSVQTLVDPKTGVTIRRHIGGGAGVGAGFIANRPHITRRFSVCSATAARDAIASQQQKMEQTTRRMVNLNVQQGQREPTHTKVSTTVANVPMVSISKTFAVDSVAPKPNVRVRYAQQPTVTGSNTVTTSVNVEHGNNPKFLAPTAQNNQEIGPIGAQTSNESMCVDVESSKVNKQKKHQSQQQQQHQVRPVNLQELMENEPKSTVTAVNCLITSDPFDKFIIKNEPLDVEDDGLL